MNGSQDQQNIQKPAQSADLPIGIEKGKLRTCNICNRLLPISEFRSRFNHVQNKRYLSFRCKKCENLLARKYRERKMSEVGEAKFRKAERERMLISRNKNRESAKKSSRLFYSKNKDYYRNYTKEWRLKNSHKTKCHTKLNNAIKYGKILKPDSCEVCGKTGCVIIGHHEDYSKPFDVKWVCASCHLKIHIDESKLLENLAKNE